MAESEGRREWRMRIPALAAGWLRRGRRKYRAAARGRGSGPLSERRAERRRTVGLLWKVMAHGTEPGNPRGLLLAWPRWEHFAHSMWPTAAIPGAPYDLLRVRLVPYEGESLALPDATEIRPGTIVGELHCNNQAILQLVSRGEVNPYRAAREDLRCLARWIAQPGFDINVRAFRGITLLANAAARLGFSVRPRPVTLRRRLDRMFMTGLLMLYTVDGLTRIDKGSTVRSYPQEVWMSRRELLRRYGTRGAIERGGAPASTGGPN